MNSDAQTLYVLLAILQLILGFLWENREGIITLIVLILLVGILINTTNTARTSAGESEALRDLNRLIREWRRTLTDELAGLHDNDDEDSLHDVAVRLEEEIKSLHSESHNDAERLRKAVVRLQVEIESWRADAWRLRHKENDTKEE